MSRKMNTVAEFQMDFKSAQIGCILLSQLNTNIVAFVSNLNAEILVFNPMTSITPQITLRDSSSSSVSAIECLKNTSILISGNERGLINLIDIESTKTINTFAKHFTTIKSLKSFNDDRNLFVSGSLDTSVRLWDIRQKQDVFVFKGHSKQVNDVFVSPDDSLITSCSDDGLVKLWNKNTCKLIQEFRTEVPNQINCTAIHPRDFQLCFGGVDRQVNFYNIENFKFQGISKEMPSPISCLLYDTDGKNLYVGGSGYLKMLSPFDNSITETIETSWKKAPKLLFFDNEIYGLAVHSNSVRLSKIGMNFEKMESEKNKKHNFDVISSNQSGMNKIEVDDQQEQSDLVLLQNGHVQIMNTLRMKVDTLSPIVNAFYLQNNLKAASVAIEKLNDDKVITDLLNVFMNNGTIRKINIDFATLMVKKASIIFDNKYKFCLKTSLKFTIEIIKQFSQDIISIKAFSQLAKCDIERDERIKKYDAFLTEIDIMIKKKFFTKLISQFQAEDIGILAQKLISDYTAIITSINK